MTLSTITQSLARLPATALLRGALVIVFLTFGYAKWFDYEAMSVAPLIAQSPFLQWLQLFGEAGASRFLGIAELTAAVLLTAGAFSPRAGLAGAALSSVTFVVTVSLMFTLPGGIWHAPNGFPALEPVPGGFLMKDLVLLAASLVLLRDAALRIEAGQGHRGPVALPAE